ncbi:MAG: hypothetical protein V1744_03085 [Candidatus Altiarchaeota archaeon]
MVNARGYSGVLLDVIKSERMVILGPIVFVNFFAVGYILHGVVFAFKTLELSQILICVTLSMILFFGELVMLLIPIKVWVDHKLARQLRKERDIIKLSFDEQDREIFRRIKVESNSIILLLTGLINYFLMALFLFMWYSNNGQPLPIKVVVNALIPVYGFYVLVNVLAAAYDMLAAKEA